MGAVLVVFVEKLAKIPEIGIDVCDHCDDYQNVHNAEIVVKIRKSEQEEQRKVVDAVKQTFQFAPVEHASIDEVSAS